MTSKNESLNPLKSHKKRKNSENQKQHVFIVGSKGIPAAYGGFETFVEKLTQYRKSENIQYHVAVLSDHTEVYEHNNARCFTVNVPDIGSAKAIYYDCVALQHCINYCRKRPDIKEPIFYILACRIGPLIRIFKWQIRALGGHMYVNPDGHEWLREKWSPAVRKYWKFSEKRMVRHAELLVCDSKSIERYVQKEYSKYRPRTTFIAYGSETEPSMLSDTDTTWVDWCKEHDIKAKEYYLVVGRFVPENNYETMIREFMKSNTDKSFALVTNVSGKFLSELKKRTGFHKDPRVKFVGTVYDQQLLKKVRENAYGYFHGHEVGGTNPSLLEALGLTTLNLLLDVGFNREVGEDGALYWTKEPGSLAGLIDKADKLSQADVAKMGRLAKKRIEDEYTWDYIVDKYEYLFLTDKDNYRLRF